MIVNIFPGYWVDPKRVTGIEPSARPNDPYGAAVLVHQFTATGTDTMVVYFGSSSAC